jgi:hypothetical protein
MNGMLTLPSLFANSQVGDAGGAIYLEKPATNSSLTAKVTQDIYANLWRMYESAGGCRGVYIDLTECANGSSSGIYHYGNFVEGAQYCGIDPNHAGKINPERSSADMPYATSNVTLSLNMAGTQLHVENGSATVVTIPNDSMVAFPNLTEIEILRRGGGDVAITAVSGVILLCPTGARTISAQWQSVCLKKLWENTWLLQGALG